MSTNTEREELARIATGAFYESRSSLHAMTSVLRLAWFRVADAILAAGYRKAKILGYAVVDERNTPLMVNFAARKAAEEYALETSRRMNRQYRVAEIVEALEA